MSGNNCPINTQKLPLTTLTVIPWGDGSSFSVTALLREELSDNGTGIQNCTNIYFLFFEEHAVINYFRHTLQLRTSCTS